MDSALLESLFAGAGSNSQFVGGLVVAHQLDDAPTMFGDQGVD